MEAAALIVAVLVALVALASTIVGFGLYFRERTARKTVEEGIEQAEKDRAEAVARLGSLPSVEAEAERIKAESDALAIEVANARKEEKRKQEEFLDQYSVAMNDLEGLRKEIAVAEDDLEMQGFALYQPTFKFEDLDQYKTRIKAVVAEQKALIKAGKAATCNVEWSVDGSLKKGKAATKQRLKLMIRAFNGECDAAISKARSANYSTMEARIDRSFSAINKLATQHKSQLTSKYRQLRLKELQLTCDEAFRKEQVREEQKEIKARMREEAAEAKKLEREQRAAEKEESQQKKALDTALKQLGKAHADQRQAMMQKVAELESKLAEASEKTKRASMAQKTRAGHVYVISNAGSFGNNVFKVGMTRRIDPMERVIELGDASVPFRFDVHAMIFSEDAPTLENALHQRLEHARMNMVNRRREYFRVELGEIEQLVHEIAGPQAEFINLMPAPEYRESLAIKAKLEGEKTGTKPTAPPDRVVLDAKQRFESLKAKWHGAVAP